MSSQQRVGCLAVGWALLWSVTLVTPMADPAAVRRVSYAAAVPGARGLVASPFQFIVTGEDHLEITSFNSGDGVVIGVDLRVLDEDTQQIQVMRRQHVPNSDRTAASEVYALAPGAVLNVRAVAISGTPRIGHTFVILRIVRGIGNARIALGTLLQGYVTTSQDVGWPGSPIDSSIAGGGVIRHIVGTNPGSGSEVFEQVPTGARWELLTLRVELTTSAIAADRLPRLRIESNTNTILVIPAPDTTPASDTAQYMWTAGLAQTPSFDEDARIAGLPTPLYLLEGHRFETDTEFFAAGDVWGAPVFTVREWLEAQ